MMRIFNFQFSIFKQCANFLISKFKYCNIEKCLQIINYKLKIWDTRQNELFFSKKKHTVQYGFTLIELVVTMGIMAVITAVTLANHSKFGGQVMLRNLAYEMALVVREAQTYGVSVRKIDDSNINDFDAGYGIHFDVNNTTTYKMFTDTYKRIGGSETRAINGDGDGLYTTPLEEVSEYTIGRGYKINKLYALQSNGVKSDASNCSTGNNVLDIVFKRPEPDAIIRLCGDTNTIYSAAEIELISPRDDIMRVLVEVSGQISVIK